MPAQAVDVAIMSSPIVLIPARMASVRLPGKPLADICGEPMIVHVWRRAIEADVGPVAIATDSAEVASAVESVGGRAVMTSGTHQSGSDRIHEAIERLDPERRHDMVVNIQGDLPTIGPGPVRATLATLDEAAADIGTIAARIRRVEERDDPNVVKVIGSTIAPGRMRALYFTRATAPSGEGPLYHHIGLYAYRRAALQRFVRLPPSPLETRERLEQLRALEAGMRIDVTEVDAVPLGVDTPHELERARELMRPT
jgi:3-deoxy-manno-octulosonate cytidylyltransferase (CMP-KDO synthetase)